MEFINISSNHYLPNIDLNTETGTIDISGESYPNYPIEIFQPVFDWLKDYTKDNGKKIMLNFRMSYFNTGSSDCFLKIMKTLVDYHFNKNGDITINWHYEKTDLDMLECGEEYLDDLKFEINLIAY